jgi:hypothetical protein
VCILVMIKGSGTITTVAIKLVVGIKSEGFISFSYTSRCRLSKIRLFVGVNQAL